jgi:branched-chain amino acid transport system permease protein
MVIIGGLGSILGSFLGAAFIVILPIAAESVPRPGSVLGIRSPRPAISHLEHDLRRTDRVLPDQVEPHGLARLWSTGKEKLRLWPFPH